MAQEVKNDIKKALQVNTIPLIAIMTAVTTVLTMLVKIPTPIRGYLNLSDTMIYFSAYAFGPWVGGIIGGLGPALSDLISGYPQWACRPCSWACSSRSSIRRTSSSVR